MAKVDLDKIAADLGKFNGLIGAAVPTFSALLGLAKLGYDVLKRQSSGQAALALEENLAIMREGTLTRRADEWDAANPKKV